jgi:UDP-N-acetylglucosamine 2-epimerase (non-hydrolysing)
VAEGTNTVVGRDADRIIAEARRVLEHGVEPRRPELWDGHAGDRIAQVLVDRIAAPGPRPTDRPE